MGALSADSVVICCFLAQRRLSERPRAARPSPWALTQCCSIGEVLAHGEANPIGPALPSSKDGNCLKRMVDGSREVGAEQLQSFAGLYRAP